MTEEKVRVKELATELGVAGKDVLGILRELNIPAKSLVATISGEDAAKVKARVKDAAGSPERRATESGVIVRRRRRDADASATDELPTQESAPGSQPELEAAAPKGKDAEKSTEAPEAPAGKAPVAETVAETKPRSRQPEKEPVKAARIIQRPQDAAKAAQADAEKVAAEAAQPIAAQPEAPAVSEPVVNEVKVSSEKTAQTPKGKEQKEAKPDKPQVRIIKPAMANISAEPERGADGQALSSVPVLAPRSDRDDEQTVFEDGQGTHTDDGASQVRVISRPDPNRAPRPPQGGRPDAPRGGRPYNGPGGGSGAPGQRPGGPGGPGQRPGGPGGPGQRPGGPGGRPFTPGGPGQRPGGGPGGPGRPFTPGGAPRPAFGGPVMPAMPGETADRSKKKGQKGRRTVDFNAGGDDFSKRRKDMASDDGSWSRNRRKPRKNRDQQRTSSVTQPIKAAKRKIRVDEFIRVSDLAHQMGLKASEIIKVLFNLGVMATINNMLDVDTATLVASEFEYEVEKVGFSEQALLEEAVDIDTEESLKPRPPVVTIMGHVDHGKTSLLDAIRKATVATGEAGGITQHIGAYHVKTKKGEIVFLDTPGHEAFTAMRARGAKVTDIVVLVVAADDGVMEQTREAVSHAKAAEVPIMVAVNKMDKPEANPERVKRELADLGLVPEEWGGQTTFSYVSAKSREGVDELLELLALQADILELKANPDKPARGHIIEAKLDKGRGSLGTVLIQQGTLKLGDSFVCGAHFGRVRAMFDDQGRKVKQAGPSIPVEVQGFEGVPEAGEEFISIADEKAARRIADTRAMKLREKALAKESRVTLETFLSRKADAVEALVLNLVVKADVQGSLEAITEAVLKLSTEKVRLNVIHGGAGAISESDVLLASASDAIIIGFNVRPSPKAKELIEQEKVDTRYYDIIYKLVEEMKSAMTGMLAPVSKEVYLGNAEVRETFSVPKIGTIAGCHVSDGKILRNAQVRLLRDNVVIYTGKISSLKRFKDDAREVLKGYECGIGLERYNDLKVGDVIEAFEMIEEAATL